MRVLRVFRTIKGALALALVGMVLMTIWTVGAWRVSAAEMMGAAGHDMSSHMRMTDLRPAQPGDQARADEIVVQARKVMEEYKDYHKALAEGYTIFEPNVPQHTWHFTNNATAMGRTLRFDASKPTSLLYEKEGSGYKLVGVMYTAPFQASPDDLNARVPLSVAQWHLHTNLCMPPAGTNFDPRAKDAKFGLDGSITTAEACSAAGGRFMPHLFGWMVHVYGLEKDPSKIWAAGMDDDHMEHGHTDIGGMKM